MVRRDLAIDLEFRVTADEKEADIESGLCALVREVLSKRETQAFLTSAPDGLTDAWIDTPAPTGVDAQAHVTRVNELDDYLVKSDCICIASTGRALSIFGKCASGRRYFCKPQDEIGLH
jgi:hypothetical protein